MPRLRDPASSLSRHPRRPGTHRAAPTFAILAITVLLAACSAAPLGPSAPRFDRTYVLESVNGSALPATAAQGGGQQYILLADTLRFGPDGSVARSQTIRHVSTDPTPRDTVYHSRMTLPYTVDGSRLTIGWRQPCPANAICIGFEEGVVTESTATVLGRLLWPGERVFRFRRAPNA